MHVCMSNNIFRKPWRRKFIFAHPVYLQGIRVKFVYGGHRVRSRSHEQKCRKSLFYQCKTSIGNNSGSIKHKAIKFAYTADRMVWPTPFSRDRSDPARVTKYTHSWVVGLKLEGNIWLLLLFCPAIVVTSGALTVAVYECRGTVEPFCLSDRLMLKRAQH